MSPRWIRFGQLAVPSVLPALTQLYKPAVRTHFAFHNMLELKLDAIAYNSGSACRTYNELFNPAAPRALQLSVSAFSRDSARELGAPRLRAEALR